MPSPSSFRPEFPHAFRRFEQRIEEIKKFFGGALIITRKQFREFMQISASTEFRMFKTGNYPRTINLPNGYIRIAVDAIAEWIECGGGQTRPSGRPVHVHNH